jgi:hypothetical protein
MSSEPPVRRVVAFFDGQNLFHAAKRAFGYHYPTTTSPNIVDPENWTAA